MKFNILKSTVIGLVITLSNLTHAGVIYTDFSTTLQLESGADTLGLNGATISIHAQFDDTAVYANRFNFPSVDALMHTITIEGATVSSSNGEFIDPDGLVYYPTFWNSFETTAGNFLKAGPLSIILMETFETPTSSVSIGDTIDISHFNTVNFDPRNINYQSIAGDSYNWVDSSFVVSNMALQTAVPEPSTFAIFALGIMGLAIRRGKKQA